MEMIGRRLNVHDYPATVVDVEGLDGNTYTLGRGKMERSAFNLRVVVEEGEGKLRITSFTDTLPMEYPKSVVHWNPHLEPKSKSECADLYLDALAQQKQERKRQAAESARRDQEHAALKEAFAAARPDWAVAAIVAEYREDKSDSQTDYFAHSTTKRVVIAWSKHKRNNFKEFRKAAAQYEPTAHLAEAGKDAEHRENWSMGGGYFLKDGYRHDTGWAVKKDAYICDEEALEIAEHLQPGQQDQAAQQAAPAVTALDGVKIVENAEKGGIELYFSSKPAQATLDALKAARFRWHRRGKYWYAKATAERRALVDELFGIDTVEAEIEAA